MKKILIFPLTVLLLLLFSLPVLADAQLTMNGRDYKTGSSLILQDGLSFAASDVVAGALGCDIAVQGDAVTLQENDTALTFTAGSKTALVNGQEKQMPAAPFLKGNQVFLPLRFVCESLGAEVSWNDPDKKVLISYIETRDSLTAEELILKTSEKMVEANSYKMKFDMDMNMDVAAPDQGAAGEGMKIATSSHGEAWVQYDPLLMYMVQNASIPESQGVPATEIKSEMVLKDNSMYMTMPEVGWVKMDLAGLDIQQLMSKSMDPAATMKVLKEAGVSTALANDREVNGQSYWVINMAMGKEMLESDYFQQMVQSLSSAAANGMDMTGLLDSLDFDFNVSTWVNQDTLLTDYMDMKGTMALNLDLPEQEPAAKVTMNMEMDGKYSISDYGTAFEIPDVSGAVDFNTVVSQQVTAVQE